MKARLAQYEAAGGRAQPLTYQDPRQAPNRALLPGRGVDRAIDRAIGGEEELKDEMGDKYEELGELVTNMKANLKRLGEMARRSRPLTIKMQHVYQYSKWDAIHEPYNVVENVLKDDEKVYKALSPSFDFTVNNGA